MGIFSLSKHVLGWYNILSHLGIMKRKASVIWNGSGKEGSGLITTQSKAMENVKYAYTSRFEEGEGTNPEELIAAAHAGCYSMKLSFLLEEAGFKTDTIETKSTITLLGGKITESHLTVHGKVPGCHEKKFAELAEKAKEECPVSKALNVEMKLDASLGNENEYSPDESFIL
jgi:lipoyl-dependent peroxiredoxin